MSMPLIVFLKFCLCCLPMLSLSLSFVEHPTDQAVIVGSEANFSCEVDVLGNDQEIAWYSGLDSQISQGGMIIGGQPEHAEILVDGRRYTLRITMAQIIDSRQYHCAVLTMGSISVELRSLPANLKVYFLPTSNDLKCSSGQSIREGELANISCDSSKGNPPVVLAWTRSDSRTIDHGTDVDYKINDQLRTEIQHQFNISRYDSNVTFTCASTSPAFFPDYRETCDVMFNVLFPPNEPLIRATEMGKLVCQCSGNPQPEVNWSVEGSSNYTVVILGDVLSWNTTQMCDNVTLATCTVSNSLGQRTNQAILCNPREQEMTTSFLTTGRESSGTVTEEGGVEESTEPGQSNPIHVILPVSAVVTTLVILAFIVIAMAMYKTSHKQLDKDSEDESHSRGISDRESSSSSGAGNVEEGDDTTGYTTSVPEYSERNETADSPGLNSDSAYLYIAEEAANIVEMRKPDGDGDDDGSGSTNTATDDEDRATGPIDSEVGTDAQEESMDKSVEATETESYFKLTGH